jgi:hypothetical protein
MPIEEQAIGVVAARLMETIAARYGEDATIGTVAVLASVHDRAADRTITHFTFTPGTAPHVGVGLLTVGLDGLLKQMGDGVVRRLSDGEQ